MVAAVMWSRLSRYIQDVLEVAALPGPSHRPGLPSMKDRQTFRVAGVTTLSPRPVALAPIARASLPRFRSSGRMTQGDGASLRSIRADRRCRELPLVAPFNRARYLETQTHGLNITDETDGLMVVSSAVHLNWPPEVLNTNSTSSLALLSERCCSSAPRPQHQRGRKELLRYRCSAQTFHITAVVGPDAGVFQRISADRQ